MYAMYGHVSCCRTCIILGQRQFLPHVVVFLHTRTSGTRLQTTVMQVSRVRRGATQRDYNRLLYYTFCRFAARKIWHGRVWNDWYGVLQLCQLCEKFLRAARGLEDITVCIT